MRSVRREALRKGGLGKEVRGFGRGWSGGGEVCWSRAVEASLG